MRLWGIDLHTDSITACFFDPDNEKKRTTRKYPLSGEGFRQFLGSLGKDDYIAIETTGNSFWFHEQVSPYVKECFVLNTNKASRSLTCSLLSQSVNHLKVAGPYFDSFYTRLRAGKSAGKSRMALIRKVIVSAYYMLKRNQEFIWKNEKNVERKKVELQRTLRRYAKKKLA